MIVFLADPARTALLSAAVLALAAWAIDHLHLPLGLLHLLAGQVVAAVVTVIFLAELGRAHARRTSRTTTNGDTHA